MFTETTYLNTFFPKDLNFVEYVLIKSNTKRESCAAIILFHGWGM